MQTERAAGVVVTLPQVVVVVVRIIVVRALAGGCMAVLAAAVAVSGPKGALVSQVLAQRVGMLVIIPMVAAAAVLRPMVPMD